MISSKPTAPSQAPPASPTTPQEASRAADLAAAEAVTESDSAQPPEPKPELPSDHATETTPSTIGNNAENVPTPPAPPGTKPNTESALKDHATPATPNPKKGAKSIKEVAATTTPSKVDDVLPPATPTKAPNTKPALEKAPKIKTPSAASIELPPPKYHVSRSKSKNLPIYTDFKRGGNLHLTTVRKITGDLSALRDEVRVYLNKKNEDVKVNSLTAQIIIKGHHKTEVQKFLEMRGM